MYQMPAFARFSKGKHARENLNAARPYKPGYARGDRPGACGEAWDTRRVTEVCLQGGIHPDYDRCNTYLDGAGGSAKTRPRSIHVHAFSPLESLAGRPQLWGIGAAPTT